MSRRPSRPARVCLPGLVGPIVLIWALLAFSGRSWAQSSEIHEDDAPAPTIPEGAQRSNNAEAAPPTRQAGRTAYLTGRLDDDEPGGTPQGRFEAALGLVRGGRQREAADALLALYHDLPGDDIAPEALFEAAQLYEEQLGDPQTALRLYGEVRERYPQSRLYRRAQGRERELTLGLRSGAPALLEFNDIVANFRTGAVPGVARSIERLEKLLRDRPDFALADHLLYLVGGAYRDVGDDARARQALLRLIADYPQSQWAPRARQALGELLLSKGDYAGARKSFAALRPYSGLLWTAAADEGIAQVDRAERRVHLGWAGALYLLVLSGLLGYWGRRHLLSPPVELYYYVPVAAFLLLLAYLSGGGPVGRTVLFLALGGTMLTWLSSAASRAAGPRWRSAAGVAVGVIGLAVAVAALVYLTIYANGIFDVVVETLRNGPETG